MNAGGSPLYGNLDIPATCDWQNRVAVPHTVDLDADSIYFGIAAMGGGWKLNWFCITMTWMKVVPYLVFVSIDSLSLVQNVYFLLILILKMIWVAGLR
jgi:hypothetical protein